MPTWLPWPVGSATPTPGRCAAPCAGGKPLLVRDLTGSNLCAARPAAAATRMARSMARSVLPCGRRDPGDCGGIRFHLLTIEE
jgi:hypothetical protein